MKMRIYNQRVRDGPWREESMGLLHVHLQSARASFPDVMWRSGLLPNVITLNLLISACEKGQQWHRALGFLGEVRISGLRRT